MPACAPAGSPSGRGRLSLPLFVLGIDTNHTDHILPSDDLAFLTQFFYRSPDLHVFTSFPVFRTLVALFVNTVAFEYRMAAGSKLRSLRCTGGVRLSRTPWWDHPTTLSVRHHIYEQGHLDSIDESRPNR